MIIKAMMTPERLAEIERQLSDADPRFVDDNKDLADCVAEINRLRAPLSDNRMKEIERRYNDPTLKQLFSDEMFDVLVHTSADLRDCMAEIKRLRDGIDRFTKLAVIDCRAELAEKYAALNRMAVANQKMDSEVGKLNAQLQAVRSNVVALKDIITNKDATIAAAKDIIDRNCGEIGFDITTAGLKTRKD